MHRSGEACLFLKKHDQIRSSSQRGLSPSLVEDVICNTRYHGLVLKLRQCLPPSILCPRHTLVIMFVFILHLLLGTAVVNVVAVGPAGVVAMLFVLVLRWALLVILEPVEGWQSTTRSTR